jgi:hypothetical protein
VEYLVRGRFVLTKQERFGADGIVKDSAVCVSGKNIIEVGRYNDLKTQYPTATIITTAHSGPGGSTIKPGMMNRWCRIGQQHLTFSRRNEWHD